MSTVVCDELVTILEQPFTVEIPMAIACVKLYLISVNAEVESVKLEILKDADVLFSKSLTFNEMKAMLNTSENNFHGFFPFHKPGTVYLNPGPYKLRLSAEGYVFSQDCFIGWCKDPLRAFGKISGEAPSDFRMNPYSYRILEFQQRER